MLQGDEPLPQGIVHHSKRDPNNIRKVAVTCRSCGTERYVFIPRGVQREKEGFTGACHSCAMGVRKEVWRHPLNGATILWGKRVHGKKHLVPFICINCGEEKIVRASQVYTKAKKWSGWCSGCIEERGSVFKVTDDLELKPWGSWIFFSQSDGKSVPVKCGLCRRTRLMSRKSVLCNYQKGMTGYCQNRFECNKARLEWESGSQRENGNGKKRGPGRPPEDRTAEHEQLKARFESVILKLEGELPIHKIKRPAIAAEYASRGESIDPSTVTKRVQLLYGEDISVADAVVLVLSKNRENNSGN